MKVKNTRLKLWCHLVSVHKCIIDPFGTLLDLNELHEHEHDGPGTIRNHPRADRSYSLKKLGEVSLGVRIMRLTLVLLLCAGCTIPSRVGPPVGHRREVCDKPDGGDRYIGALRAGDALFYCPPEYPYQ